MTLDTGVLHGYLPAIMQPPPPFTLTASYAHSRA